MSKPVNRNFAIAEIMQSLRRIFKAIQDYSQEVSKKFGVTGPQLWALKTIYANEIVSLGDKVNEGFSVARTNWDVKNIMTDPQRNSAVEALQEAVRCLHGGADGRTLWDGVDPKGIPRNCLLFSAIC